MTTHKKKVRYWYPWTPSWFREKTIHLTYAQRGLYRDLIDYYMETKKALPDNDIALANICRIDLSTWQLHSVEIRAMFVKIKDEKGVALLSQNTCDENLAFDAARSKKNSKNGQKGGRPKAMKDNDKKPLAKPNESTTDNIQQIAEEERISSLTQESLKTPLTPQPIPGGDSKSSISGKEEHPAAPQARFDILHLISDDTHERAKRISRALNRDFYELAKLYNAGVREGKRPAPDKPDAAFMAWIPAYTKGKKL